MSDADRAPALVISGAAGRMGGQLLKLIADTDSLRLAGALESPGNDPVGEPLKNVESDLSADLRVNSDPAELLSGERILVDFTRPEATAKLVEVAREKKTPAVIGTTGLTDETIKKIRELSRSVPVVHASNMSLGINLFRKLLGEAAGALGEDFDVEVLEMHHRHKEDAPSGTALTLAEDVAEARDQDLDDVASYGREGFTGERDSEEIGIMALRGGDVAGDHTVMFAGEGERLEFTHRASSRETFARGALRAARFVDDAEPGLYDMRDVLFG